MNELIINKTDLIHNINVIKSKEENNYTIIAVVKGNAYGLGLKEMVNILKSNDIDYFAVSTYEEALEFREYFSDKLLLLTPYYDEEKILKLIELDVIFTIESIKQAITIDKLCKQLDKKVYAHIKIDTGLNRYGFRYDDINSIINSINNTENIKYYGIYSHFSTSLSKNPKFTNIQYNRFINVIEELNNKGIEFKLKHICNSSGYFKYKNMHLNCSRIGSAFIGCATGIKTDLKPIGTFHTKIVKTLDLKKGEYIGYAKSYKVKNDITVGIIDVGYYSGIGKTLIDQRFYLKSKLKKVLLDIKNVFKTEYVYLSDLKVLGQIGMNDIVLDITNKNYNINDDLYFYVRPTLIDSSIKRVYKTNNKINK